MASNFLHNLYMLYVTNTISSWLQWDLMTLIDPPQSLAYLIYLGYTGDPATAFCVTRKRSLDFKKQHTQRHVFQCFVFWPQKFWQICIVDFICGKVHHFINFFSFSDFLTLFYHLFINISLNLLAALSKANIT